MWLSLFLWAASTMLSYVLRPRLPNVQPAGKSDFQIPTVEEGRTIPKVFGTVHLKAPMVAWYSYRTFAITESHGFDHITVAYRYIVTAELIYCSGQIDVVEAVYFDNHIPKYDILNTFSDHVEYHLNDEWLFGGSHEGGGVKGYLEVYFGTPTQAADSYLQTAKNGGNPIPANRRLCYAVCRDVYLGTSKYIKLPTLRVRRTPNGLNLTGGAHNIGGDANPANMLFDLITSSHEDSGMGVPAGLIDIAGWAAVGQTLATEGLGLSMILDRPSEAHVEEILRHIDAVIYLEPMTGLLVLKLIRADYNPLTLPVFDNSNSVVENFARPSWQELPNKILVRYTDRADNFKEKIAPADNLAAITIRGGEVEPEEIPFLGLSNAANGQKAASRCLAIQTYPLGAGSMRADRSAWSLRPGSPFILKDPPRQIESLICRVVKLGTGVLEDGRIPVSFTEDVYGADYSVFAPPPATGWVDPSSTVPSLLAQLAINAPYETVKNFSPGPDSQARALTMARGGAGVVSGYRLYVKRNDATWPPPTDVLVQTPTTVLNSSVSITTTTIVLTANADTDELVSLSDADFQAGKNLLWLDDEFIVFQTVTQGSGIVTLGGCVRACLDTVPQVHSSGKRVWIISAGVHIQDINTPVTSLTETVRFQAFNSKTEVPFASAPDVVFTCNKPTRAALPLVPAKFLIVGAPYPTTIGPGTGLQVSWQHRNRLASWNYANSGVTGVQEAGVTYTVKIYGDGGTLKHTETGITSDIFIYSTTTEMAENGGILNSSLRVQVFAVRGTDQSWQMFDWSFTR